MATSFFRGKKNPPGGTNVTCTEFDVNDRTGSEHVSPDASGLRYMARQPILDSYGRVHGYELLFRAAANAVAFTGDGDTATRAVLNNSVIFGIERLSSGLPIFVNCTAEALLRGLVLVLPPDQTVLELLETLNPTAELHAACRELKKLGYRIALDDFEYAPEWEPMLDLADYVKVDLTRTTHLERLQLIQKCAGPSTKLVLERVETPAELELGKREGFHFFQGYHFCRPELMKSRSIPANRVVHLEMLHALHDDPLDVKRVGDLVKRDASLTYRLLRMVNSPLYTTSKIVGSILGALVHIGDEMFRRVAILAIACELDSACSSELLQMAFLRGRFCELAAHLMHQDPTEQYLLGILSLLPAMLKVPMENIAEALPLREEVRLALLGEGNRAGAILRWLEYYEHAEWNACEAVAQAFGFTDVSLPAIYAEALLWAEANMSLASGA
jgi:c-di-GMP phosphodiesterase